MRKKQQNSQLQQRYDSLKIIRNKQRNEYQENPTKTFIGNCLQMCPEFEIVERELQFAIDLLEKVLL